MKLRELLVEGPSAKSTVVSIVADIGNPIESVYRVLRNMAEKFYENKGDLKGFGLMAAGVGAKWYNTFYFNKLQSELYDLVKLVPKRTRELKDFLSGEEVKGELELPKRFSKIARELPEILEQIGRNIDAPDLTRAALRWKNLRDDFERFLKDLESQDDDMPVINRPQKVKSGVAGQQNQQAENIVNAILKKISPRIAGDIRNIISRSPNKLIALQQELERRGLNAGELSENASPGATSSANIGTVVSPHLAIGKDRGKKSYTGSPGKSGTKAPAVPKAVQAKNPDGTAKNALDMKGNIFGGGAVKR